MPSLGPKNTLRITSTAATSLAADHRLHEHCKMQQLRKRRMWLKNLHPEMYRMELAR